MKTMESIPGSKSEREPDIVVKRYTRREFMRAREKQMGLAVYLFFRDVQCDACGKDIPASHGIYGLFLFGSIEASYGWCKACYSEAVVDMKERNLACA